MKKTLLLLPLILSYLFSLAQATEKDYAQALNVRIDTLIVRQYRSVQPYFQEAYSLHPTVPRGILEAVAFTYSRFNHLVPPDGTDATSYMPATYGVMGLTADGRGYFKENLHLVAQLSGFPEEEVKGSPRGNIIAYAAAYAKLQQDFNIFSADFADNIPILEALSELPDGKTPALEFARKSNLYAFTQFLGNGSYRQLVGCTMPPISQERCFGAMLPLLQSSSVDVIGNEVVVGKTAEADDSDARYEQTGNDAVGGTRAGTTDYAGAIWNPAASCNYSSRNGREISAITVHYTQGTYAGSIAWFQNCSAQVSAHYVLRSSDGQITQMVQEADKSWHVGNSNGYTIGLEHEAYGDIASYFTPAMYRTSADLTRNICQRNNINPLRMFYRDTLDNGTVLNYGLHSLGSETSCIKIKGHQHFPDQSHTDPGPFWNWNYYFKLVNNTTPYTTFSSATGTFTDSGGATGDYSNDERKLYLIQVPNAEHITLTFSDFDLEDDYDFMWIYDGSTEFSPLIGRWNTQSPGTVTSSGNALLIEFRSDCATTAAGWVAQWNASTPVVDTRPETEILWNANDWITHDFDMAFIDTDDHAVAHRFFQLMGYDGSRWTANPQRGFFCDNFDNFNTQQWNVQSGNWGIANSRLQQSGSNDGIIYSALNGDLGEEYLYDLYISVPNTSIAGSSVGIEFSSNSSSFRNREYAYAMVLFPCERVIKLYRIVYGVRWEAHTITNISTAAGANYLYRILHNRTTGEISIFRDGRLLGSWQDSSPLSNGSNFFALTTHGMDALFDNIRVYRSRGETAHITVGSGEDCDLIWQASNGVSKAKIKSIVADDAHQFSSLQEKNLKVDYTPPTFSSKPMVSVAFPLKNVISATWNTVTDPHSGLDGYDYDVIRNSLYYQRISWPWHTTATSFTQSLLSQSHEPQTAPYIVCVRAKNNAGLYSDMICSDRTSVGGLTGGGTLANTSNQLIKTWPNPASNEVHISVPSDTGQEHWIEVYDVCGKKMTSLPLEDGHCALTIADWAKGMYVIQILEDGRMVGSQKFIKR